MNIKKFPQSCLMVTANETKILVDPGSMKFDESFLELWKTADVILVTHKHGDHINADVIKNLNIPVYSTAEVANAYPDLEIKLIKENDTFNINEVKVEVTRAVHGYNPRLKDKAEVFENVGYIIDDGETRLYITSDTICFNNNYKVDYVFAPVTGYGLTMTAFETALFTKETGAKKLIISHLDNAIYPSNLEQVKTILKEQGVDYIIPNILEELEIDCNISDVLEESKI